jgi:hypothetical protein
MSDASKLLRSADFLFFRLYLCVKQLDYCFKRKIISAATSLVLTVAKINGALSFFYVGDCNGI